MVAKIKTGPGQTNDLELLVSPPANTRLCRISLRERGMYMPCIGGGDWRKGERFTWQNTTRLTFQEDASGNILTAKLVIHGFTNPAPTGIVEDGHILVNIPLQILPGFAGGDLTGKLSAHALSVDWNTATITLPSATAPATPTTPAG
ncbi:unnamed protein product, partial [Meganyctiphanes norvegica]